MVRVDVFALAAEPDKQFTKSVETKNVTLKPVRSRLVEKVRWQVIAFHEASVRSVDLWFAGEANDALVKLLARGARVAAGQGRVVSGPRDRSKTVFLHCDEPAEAAKRLRAWVATAIDK